MSDSSEAMDEEFDLAASWTVDAVRSLGPEYAVPAACQGSGGPAALDWLIDRLAPSGGSPLLDVGAGLGGPAAYAAGATGVTPVLVDPAEAACRSAARLFGLPVLTGDGAVLPLRTSSFDVVWSLGVLCTVTDKDTHLSEIARVMRPSGRLGLLVYERTTDDLPDPPEGNHFPGDREVEALLHRAGLQITADALLAELPKAPDQWESRADRVDAWIARHHASEAAWMHAREQQSRLGRLIGSGLVVGRMLTASVGTESA